MVSFFWNFFEFHELCSRIFRVALLFICQGTSKADRCAIILESLLSQNVLCNEMLCDSTQRAVFFCKLSLLNLLAIRRLPNGEGGIWTLAPLLTTCTLSRGVPSASWVLLQTKPKQNHFMGKHICVRRRRYLQRRGWDSNPRALADKRFSRPPRYDHFDTSPCRLYWLALNQRKDYSSKTLS